jgi:hypothetical protein
MFCSAPIFTGNLSAKMTAAAQPGMTAQRHSNAGTNPPIAPAITASRTPDAGTPKTTALIVPP